jgi:DNA-binding NarL/FixJ family response regulator
VAVPTVFLVTCAHPGWNRLRETLRDSQNLVLIGEQSDPAAAVQAVAAGHPSLVLVSFRPLPAAVFGGGTRLPLLRELRGRNSRSRLLVIGHGFTAQEALALHQLAVEGVVSWPELRGRGAGTRVQALVDGAYIRNAAFEQCLVASVDPAAPPTTLKPLSPREAEVAALMVEHLSDKQIARRLGISVNTANNHITHLRAKLGARDRMHLGMLLQEYHLPA